MKKILVVCLAAVLMIGVFAACGNEPKVDKEIAAQIAELRTNVYETSGEDIKANVITGKRENPFLVNGKAENLVEFGIITIYPAEVSQAIEYKYTLKADGNEFTGDFGVHPFGTSYTADISHTINATEITLSITCNGEMYAEDIILSSALTEDMIAWEEAVSIAKQALAEPLNQMYEGKKLSAEVYVKFLNDPLEAGEGYYWYVAFVKDNTTLACLIDPCTREVLAKREA